jgi:hypothetical protein
MALMFPSMNGMYITIYNLNGNLLLNLLLILKLKKTQTTRKYGGFLLPVDKTTMLNYPMDKISMQL